MNNNTNTSNNPSPHHYNDSRATPQRISFNDPPLPNTYGDNIFFPKAGVPNPPNDGSTDPFCRVIMDQRGFVPDNRRFSEADGGRSPSYSIVSVHSPMNLSSKAVVNRGPAASRPGSIVASHRSNSFPTMENSNSFGSAPYPMRMLPGPPSAPTAAGSPLDDTNQYEVEAYNASTLSSMRIGSLDKVACAEHGKERSAQNMVMIRNKVTNAVLWRCKPNSRCKSSHNERSRHTSEVEGIGQQDRPLQQGRGEVLLGQFSHGSVPARGDPPPPRHGEGQGRPIPGQSGMTFAPFPVLTMPFVRPQEYTLVPVNRESTALSTSPVQGDVFYVPTNPQGPYVTISNNSSHNSRQPNPFPNYPGGHPSGGGSFQGGSGLGY